MDEVEKAINQKIEEKWSDAPTEKKQQYKEVMTKCLKEGKSLKDALNFDKRDVETLYYDAYHRYQNGKFEEATQLFFLLHTLDPDDARFSLGLGGCYQQQGEYSKAIYAYMRSAAADEKTPDAFLYASNCALEMEQTGMAITLLGGAIGKMGDREKYAQTKERALLTLRTLLEKLNIITPSEKKMKQNKKKKKLKHKGAKL